MFSQDTLNFFFVSLKPSRVQPNRRAFFSWDFLFGFFWGGVCLFVWGFCLFLKVISAFGSCLRSLKTDFNQKSDQEMEGETFRVLLCSLHFLCVSCVLPLVLTSVCATMEGDINHICRSCTTQNLWVLVAVQRGASCKTSHVLFSHGSKGYFLALSNLPACVESRKFWDGRGGGTPPVHVSHSRALAQ